jgi:hypothetical protein
MKGLAIKYIFYTFIVVFFVIIAISIIRNFSNVDPGTGPIFVPNATYECIRLNDTYIDQDELEIVLYGFMTDQCTSFYSGLNERVTFEDIQKMANRMDEGTVVYEVSECKQTSTDTGSVYVNLEYGVAFRGISITRRPVEGSDILICDVDYEPVEN